jgi:hypothetical protein
VIADPEAGSDFQNALALETSICVLKHLLAVNLHPMLGTELSEEDSSHPVPSLVLVDLALGFVSGKALLGSQAKPSSFNLATRSGVIVPCFPLRKSLY